VSGRLRAPAALPPEERDPDIHWIGGWVGSRAGSDTVAKRKIPSPFRESNHNLPARSLIGKLSYPGPPRLGLEDNIRMDIKDIKCGVVDCINLAGAGTCGGLL
jgi:hypothetical protein